MEISLYVNAAPALRFECDSVVVLLRVADTCPNRKLKARREFLESVRKSLSKAAALLRSVLNGKQH